MEKENFLKDIVINKEKEDSIEITILGSEGQEEKVKIDKSSTSSTFTEYEKRSSIASKIAIALNRYGYRSKKFKVSDGESILEQIEKNGGLFFVSDINKTSGLLSVCPALSAMMNVCYSMMSKDEDAEVIHDFDDRINFSISYILNKINPNYDKEKSFEENYKNYVFDASPYIQEFEFTNEKSYLDTITWVILALQTARDLAIIEDEKKRLVLKKFENEELLDNKRITIEYDEKHQSDVIKEIEDGIVACVRMTTEMAIDVEKDGVKVNKGWSFTRVDPEYYDTTEPSLYFSYTATTVFLGLLKGFQKYISIFRKIEDKVVDFLPKGFYKDYWNHLEEVVKYKNEYVANRTLEARELNEEAFTEEEDAFLTSIDTIDIEDKVEMANISFFMNRINLGKTLRNEEHDGYFSTVKRQSIDVARDMWGTFKNVLADNFVYPNGKVVDEKSIENSGASNELFNGLFVCGVLLNSGYDMEVEGAEHDLLIDTLQACVQKTQRYYDALERNDEAYKVNNYVLQFIEKDPGNAKLGVILRKSSIKVSSLVPMLLKMNSLVSEYVIQYPQRQMKTHLVSIMKNRMINTLNQSEGVNYVWCWESDGYESITNYYYIDALNAFYNYYDKYEKQYITFDKKVNDVILNSVVFQDRIRDEIKREKLKANQRALEAEERANQLILEKDNEIKRLEKEAKQKDSEIAKGDIGRRILLAIDNHLDTKEDWIVNAFMGRIKEGIASEGNSDSIVKDFMNLISMSIFSELEKGSYLDNYIKGNQELVDCVDKVGSVSKLKEKIQNVFSRYLTLTLGKEVLDSCINEVVESLDD